MHIYIIAWILLAHQQVEGKVGDLCDLRTNESISKVYAFVVLILSCIVFVITALYSIYIGYKWCVRRRGSMVSSEVSIYSYPTETIQNDL